MLYYDTGRSGREIIRYEFRAGTVTKAPYPDDTGIRILRSFLGYVPSLNTYLFAAIRSNGTERPFLMGRRGRAAFGAFRKYRYKINITDTAADGSHVFVHNPSWSNRNETRYGSRYYTNVLRGFRQFIYHRKGLKGSPRKLASAPAFYEPRLTDGGTRIVYIRPGKADPARNRRGYVIESVDVSGGAPRKVGEFETSIRKANRYEQNLPFMHVFKASPYLMYPARFGKDRRATTAWKVVNIRNGRTRAFRLPPKFFIAPNFPVSTRRDANTLDRDGLHPYVVIYKVLGYDRATRKSDYEFRVIRVPDLKVVYRGSYKGGLHSAVYIPGDEYRSLPLEKKSGGGDIPPPPVDGF